MRSAGRRLCYVAFVAACLPASASAATEGNADDFLIVDCLLPAQVRQLGQNMTFLAPRQAIRTSAHDCAVRGGEFSRGDAGGPAGLRIWLPAAQKGDPAAQTYVGEIFERGLAGKPDYAAAVQWYRRAADQHYARAQIALGALVEQGLGTPRDPVAAERLFREAAGLPPDLPMGSEAQNKRIEELNAKLQAATAADAAKQQRLSAQDAQLRQLRQTLAARENEAKRDRSRLQQLQKRLQESRPPEKRSDDSGEMHAALAARDRELAETKASIAALSAKLAAVEKSASQTAADAQQLAKLRDALAQAQATMAADQREAARLHAELESARSSAATNETRTQDLTAALAQRDDELARTKVAIADLRGKLAAIEQAPKPPPVDPAQLERLRSELASAQKTMAAQQEESARLRKALAAENASSTTREKQYGDTVAKLQKEVSERQAGLAAKDEEIKRLKDQLASLETAPASRSVGPANALHPLPPVAIPVIEFGRYHALVIGIDNYRRLPKLETPINDAKAVAEVLQKDYGFQVTTLLDADRYQILSALNELRQKLTDKDNLLIYYAGHGVLDTVNQRGNWLPVDAEPDSTANWISNIQITDILNAMAARQILVVADSCYSGTLTRDVTVALNHARTDVERVKWYKIMISRPSRVALTSGGLEPVLDASGGKHSLFAELFLQALRKNTDAMATQELYEEIEPVVATRTADLKVHQVPEYAPIKMAGHEAGDFVFVRRAAAN